LGVLSENSIKPEFASYSRVLAEASSSKTGQVAATSGIIAQCLNLELEIHDIASKLCILRFEPLK
jgi:hypothetical protein